MAADTTITLKGTDSSGNATIFAFAGLEIPSSISGIGIAQSLGIHKQVGGDRVIDAMGQDFPPITWGGLFFGPDALDRVTSLKQLTAAGLPLTLTWHTFNYTVLCHDFSPDERRQYEIPYHITFEVVSDNAHPASDGLDYVSANEAIDTGLSTAQIQADVIADSTLSAAMTALANAMAQIEDFTSATLSEISLVMSALSTAQGRVGLLIFGADAAIGSAVGFGGVVSGGVPSVMAASLLSTQTSVTTEVSLIALQSTLGVLAANVSSAGSSPNTISVVGGNLFSIASAQYGDPIEWTAIANANGLTDPFITGPATLTIPLSPANNNGVLSN